LRIHAITHDFRLEDVWALPTPGGVGEFSRLVQLIASFDPSQSRSRPVRTLFATRFALGDILGWDDPEAGTPTLRDRLSPELREARAGPAAAAAPSRSLYVLEDEWALEIANRTVRGVLHIGWVPEETGRHRGQMAVLVKPNGLLGRSYVAAIKPFRYAIVYPALLRVLEREWGKGAGE
jgi:hypothetical protein